ncbi:MAG: hypothetical protein KF784_15240 [Fimbriimonadaceae bacterium]|nr:hypothetical protein [Fimbriimonadaceae bacterium]
MRAFRGVLLLLAIGLGFLLPSMGTPNNVRGVLLFVTAFIILGHAILYPKSINMEGKYRRSRKAEASLLLAFPLLYFITSVIAAFLTEISLRSKFTAGLLYSLFIIMIVSIVHVIIIHYYRALIAAKNSSEDLGQEGP